MAESRGEKPQAVVLWDFDQTIHDTDYTKSQIQRLDDTQKAQQMIDGVAYIKESNADTLKLVFTILKENGIQSILASQRVSYSDDLESKNPGVKQEAKMKESMLKALDEAGLKDFLSIEDAKTIVTGIGQKEAKGQDKVIMANNVKTKLGISKVMLVDDLNGTYEKPLRTAGHGFVQVDFEPNRYNKLVQVMIAAGVSEEKILEGLKSQAIRRKAEDITKFQEIVTLEIQRRDLIKTLESYSTKDPVTDENKQLLTTMLLKDKELLDGARKDNVSAYAKELVKKQVELYQKYGLYEDAAVFVTKELKDGFDQKLFKMQDAKQLLSEYRWMLDYLKQNPAKKSITPYKELNKQIELLEGKIAAKNFIGMIDLIDSQAKVAKDATADQSWAKYETLLKEIQTSDLLSDFQKQFSIKYLNQHTELGQVFQRPVSVKELTEHEAVAARVKAQQKMVASGSKQKEGRVFNDFIPLLDAQKLEELKTSNDKLYQHLLTQAEKENIGIQEYLGQLKQGIIKDKMAETLATQYVDRLLGHSCDDLFDLSSGGIKEECLAKLGITERNPLKILPSAFENILAGVARLNDQKFDDAMEEKYGKGVNKLKFMLQSDIPKDVSKEIFGSKIVQGYEDDRDKHAMEVAASTIALVEQARSSFVDDSTLKEVASINKIKNVLYTKILGLEGFEALMKLKDKDKKSCTEQLDRYINGVNYTNSEGIKGIDREDFIKEFTKVLGEISDGKNKLKIENSLAKQELMYQCDLLKEQIEKNRKETGKKELALAADKVLKEVLDNTEFIKPKQLHHVSAVVEQTRKGMQDPKKFDASVYGAKLKTVSQYVHPKAKEWGKSIAAAGLVVFGCLVQLLTATLAGKEHVQTGKAMLSSAQSDYISQKTKRLETLLHATKKNIEDVSGLLPAEPAPVDTQKGKEGPAPKGGPR